MSGQTTYYYILILCLEILKAFGGNFEDIQKLRRDLLQHYDKEAIPVLNENTPVTVGFYFRIKHILNLDEKSQLLTVQGELHITWIDNHLVWNPADYGNIERLTFKDHAIWQPDVYNILSSGKSEIDITRSTYSVVLSDGQVEWTPLVSYEVYCSTHLRHYPFDEHNCSLVFGSWSRTADKISLKISNQEDFQINEISSTQWIPLNVSHSKNEINYGTTSYHFILVSLQVKRMTGIYRFVCLIPGVSTVIVTLLSFWTQPWEPSRYIIGCLNFIMMALLLINLTLSLPAGEEIPVIAEYCAGALCLAAAFLLITVTVTIIGRYRAPSPTRLIRLLRGNLGRWLLLHILSHPAAELEYFTMATSVKTDGLTSFDEGILRTGDWFLLAVMLDRIFFCIFFLIYIIMISILMAN